VLPVSSSSSSSSSLSSSSSFSIYAAAAAAGDAESNYFCGDILENGRGVVADKAAAKRHYKIAADAGHAWGQTALGWMLEHGDDDCQRDVAAAVQLYKAASLQGHAPAQYHLACIYLAAAEDSSVSSSSSSSLLSPPSIPSSSNDVQQQQQQQLATKFVTAAHDLFFSAAKNGFVPAQVGVETFLHRMQMLMPASGCLCKSVNGGQGLFPKR
jgi:TPR repeat protein